MLTPLWRLLYPLFSGTSVQQMCAHGILTRQESIVSDSLRYPAGRTCIVGVFFVDRSRAPAPGTKHEPSVAFCQNTALHLDKLFLLENECDDQQRKAELSDAASEEIAVENRQHVIRVHRLAK
jgi:hypothetical protein